MSFLSERDRAFRGAVAVNNWAVLHMERGNFSQAIASLQEGMKLLKFVLEADHNSRSEGNITTPVLLRKVDGEGAVADPPRWCLIPSSTVSQSQNSSLKTQVFSLVYSNSSSSIESDPFASDSLPSHPSASHAFPIRIEESCCRPCCGTNPLTQEEEEEETADLASAVLLYNLGLANLLESSSHREKDGGASARSATHLDFARGLLEMSFHVMQSVSSTDNDVCQPSRDDDDDDEDMRDVERTLSPESLPFALVLVHAMHRVLTELGQTVGATIAAQDYGRILTRHLELCGYHPNSRSRRCWWERFFGGAAAAAA